MASGKRVYDAEFREGAVRIVAETGKPVPEVAEDLGIHPGTLHSWVSRARRNGSPSSDRPVAEPSGGRLRESERADVHSPARGPRRCCPSPRRSRPRVRSPRPSPGRPPCPSVLPLLPSFLPTGSPGSRPRPFGPGQRGPVSGELAGTAAERPPHVPSRFPLAFRPTGLRFLSRPVPPETSAFLTVGPPPPRQGRRPPSGFPRSAHARYGRGGRPLCPGAAVSTRAA
ncbi:transposase [Streptomyces ipomoeae]|uniref:transposase n=1 Tax=Streptomyces ipomoeae TaxID=103232 RepID=UPI001FD5B4E3|nr:transposase [Streptomyces ipomoeae]MDX2938381.1 transposase [Streptomyces ipomoeae]